MIEMTSQLWKCSTNKKSPFPFFFKKHAIINCINCNDFPARFHWKTSLFQYCSGKEQLISLKPIKHFWPGQYSSRILSYLCLKIINTWEWSALCLAIFNQPKKPVLILINKWNLWKATIWGIIFRITTCMRSYSVGCYNLLA